MRCSSGLSPPPVCFRPSKRLLRRFVKLIFDIRFTLRQETNTPRLEDVRDESHERSQQPLCETETHVGRTTHLIIVIYKLRTLKASLIQPLTYNQPNNAWVFWSNGTSLLIALLTRPWLCHGHKFKNICLMHVFSTTAVENDNYTSVVVSCWKKSEANTQTSMYHYTTNEMTWDQHHFKKH